MNSINQVFTFDNFRLIIDHAPIGIVIIDKDYKWLLINKRFTEITGYTIDELHNKTFLDITYKEDIQRNVNLYEQMVTGKYDEYSYEKRYVRKNGKIIWVRLTVAGVRINTKYEYMIALIQDIDEDKKNQVDLQYRNKELDTLFYKASHELRSPVATLEGLINLLRIELPTQSSQAFSHLVDTVNKLSAQNDILVQLARINETTIRPEELSFSAIVNEFLGMQSTARIKIELGSDLIVTDRYLLSNVIKNLLENAVTHGGEHVQISIKLATADAGYLISIHDNGPGIKPDIKPKIFDMFFKGNTKSSGSGLGLYMVKKALEKLKGEIRLAQTDDGAKFEIIIPSERP
jgi:PAS domain S-box-containing protein